MKVVFLTFAACVSALCQSSPGAAVGVYLNFDEAPPQAALTRMQREATAILRPVKLEWRALSENRGQEAFAALAVLHFTGACRPEFDPDAAETSRPVPLASTAVRDGRVLPFTEVRCDAIRRALSYAAPPQDSFALGTAMGRVIAHEIYHILGNTLRHAPRGIARSVQSWPDLFAPGMKLRRSDFQLFSHVR